MRKTFISAMLCIKRTQILDTTLLNLKKAIQIRDLLTFYTKWMVRVLALNQIWIICTQ